MKKSRTKSGIYHELRRIRREEIVFHDMFIKDNKDIHPEKYPNRFRYRTYWRVRVDRRADDFVIKNRSSNKIYNEIKSLDELKKFSYTKW